MIYKTCPERVLNSLTLLVICTVAIPAYLLRPVTPVYAIRPPQPISTGEIMPPGATTAAQQANPAVGRPPLSPATSPTLPPSAHSMLAWISLFVGSALATGSLAHLRWRRKTVPYIGQTATRFMQAQYRESKAAKHAIIQSPIARTHVSTGILRRRIGLATLHMGRKQELRRQSAVLVATEPHQGDA